MTYNALLHRLRGKSGLQLQQVRAVVENLFEQVAGNAMKGRRVAIPGFGVFYRKSHAARRIVCNGAEYHLPAQQALGFRASKERKVRR